MDRVRFGRALGFGARQAVKTLVTAVHAATAANPSASAPKASGEAQQTQIQTPERTQEQTRGAMQIEAHTPGRSSEMAASRGVSRKAAKRVAKDVTQARDLHQGLKRGSRRFGEAVWRPFVRLSGVLWLEVAGVFFGVVALTAVPWIWRERGEWRSGAPGHGHLMMGLGIAVVFGYFCVDSFVRARRRERRR